jgi:hypothetical protein
MGTGFLPLGIAAEKEANHSPQFSVKINDKWSFPLILAYAPTTLN